MKISKPLVKVKSFATGQSIRLSEKTFVEAEKVNTFFSGIGNMAQFIGQIFRETFSRGFEFKEFLSQCYKIGNKSLPLVVLTGAIMGVVLTIQSRPALARFGAVTLLPGMIAVSIIREIGPVITALI
jgi:phospholipid/cholesterol/gamma-HCH transport system permease protein